MILVHLVVLFFPLRAQKFVKSLLANVRACIRDK